MKYKGALDELSKAIISKMSTLGIAMGAMLPRAEITEIDEGATIDKDNAVRECNIVIEAISNLSTKEASDMMSNIEDGLIGEGTIILASFDSVICDKVSSTLITEVGDADILLYRWRTQFVFYLERKQS